MASRSLGAGCCLVCSIRRRLRIGLSLRCCLSHLRLAQQQRAKLGWKVVQLMCGILTRDLTMQNVHHATVSGRCHRRHPREDWRSSGSASFVCSLLVVSGHSRRSRVRKSTVGCDVRCPRVVENAAGTVDVVSRKRSPLWRHGIRRWRYHCDASSELAPKSTNRMHQRCKL